MRQVAGRRRSGRPWSQGVALGGTLAFVLMAIGACSPAATVPVSGAGPTAQVGAPSGGAPGPTALPDPPQADALTGPVAAEPGEVQPEPPTLHSLAVRWPIAEPVLSERDRNNPTMRQLYPHRYRGT